MIPATRWRRLLAACSAGLLFACGGEPVDDVSAVTLVLEAPVRAGGAGVWRDTRAETPVRLVAPAQRLLGRGWNEWEIEADAGSLGRLVAGSSPAALLYHLASLRSEFDSAMLANRLVRLETPEGVELGLAFRPASLAVAPQRVRTADLDPEVAAELIGRAEALSAWQAVANDRWPVDENGVPWLPPFVPSAFGDWRVLQQRSLESILPTELAQQFRDTHGFRRDRNRALAAALPALAGLADEVEAFRDAHGDDVALAAPLTELAELLRASASAYAAFLDSAWIELVVRRTSADDAVLLLLTHSVVDLDLDRLFAELPPKKLLTRSVSLAGLRLEPIAGGDVIRAHLGKDRIEFRLDHAQAPAAPDAQRYAGRELAYTLRGLATLGDDAWELLEGLRLRALNDATGAKIPSKHITRVVSLEDPRFVVESDPPANEFPQRAASFLVRTGGRAGPTLRLDAARRSFVLAAGSYMLREDLILPADYGLTLEAGVELSVAPKRSILVRGPLSVRGTAEQPVRVRGTSLSEAWGVLAVQGLGRSRLGAKRPVSDIAWLEITGGSEDWLAGVHYSGQLSVHHEDLRLRNSSFRNAFADDGLNLKYGRADIAACVFADNAADGVDLDFVEGVVSNSTFVRSGRGGDGLDTSGSKVTLSDSVLGSVGDKCLSVGEASTLVVRGALFRDCAVAIASKDRSLVEVEESLFLENARNFAAYEKKPIFGGARLRASRVSFLGQAEPDQADAISDISVEDVDEFDTTPAELAALRETSTYSSERYRARRARRAGRVEALPDQRAGVTDAASKSTTTAEEEKP